MRVALYITDAGRARAIERAESWGETMLHDDFGVGPNGEHQLTFIYRVKVPPTPEALAHRARVEALGARTIGLPDLIELLAHERGI